MRISDWSSDVCSSDLKRTFSIQTPFRSAEPAHRRRPRSEYATCQIQHCHEPGEAVTFIRRKRRIVLKTAVDGSARADDARNISDRHCRISHQRSDERRVGKEWVRPGRSRWSPCLKKK